jgi:hypothetical protein
VAAAQITGYVSSVTKPIVFFSHSSRDAVALRRLKDRFVELTGGTIDIFLSSDGQSIRLGRNWLASVEQALSEATLMFVFLSPKAVSSAWIYFESGHAYAKKLDVVPVGLFGIDIGSIPAPLSILQGFNVTGHESLNNIITKANERFGYSHRPGFLREDYEALQSTNSFAASPILSTHVAAVRELELSIKHIDDIDEQRFLAAFEGIETTRLVRGSTCSIPGAAISLATAVSGPSGNLHATIEPSLASLALPIVEQVFKKCTVDTAGGAILPYAMTMTMRAGIGASWRHHIVMARLHGTRAVLQAEHRGHSDLPWFRHDDLYFSVGHSRGNQKIEISLQCSGRSFAVSNVGTLLDLLFESDVLRYEEMAGD